MSDKQPETIPQAWHKQAFFKTYWFWGLVLISFLLRFSEVANSPLMFSWTEHGVSFGTFTQSTYLGMLAAGLLSVYFLRIRLKKSFVIFTLVYLLSLILLRFGPTTHSAIYLAGIFFINIGYFGIVLTILGALVTAKLHLKSFLIAILIIWFWKSIGEILSGVLSFSYSDLENQIIGFYDYSSEGDIKPSAQDVFFYYSTCFLPAALAVLAALRLNSKKIFGRSVLKAGTGPALPLQAEPSGWLWQDLVSSYRFWGLVLVSFFVSIAGNANLFLGVSYPGDFAEEYGRGLQTLIAYAPAFIAGLLTLYFVKGRIKAPLIGFSLLFLISISLMRFARLTDVILFGPVLYMVVDSLRDIGAFGVVLTILSALVIAKLPLKSFFIAFFIIWFWFYIGDILGFAYDNIHRTYTPIDDAKTPPASFVFFEEIVPLFPAVFAILAALKLKPGMFFSPPDITVEAKPAKAREPMEVSFLALIVPFYFLYWLFKQPGELKTLAPDMHQPSPLGALCLGLFASPILPIWFYGVRKRLGPALKHGSARRLAVVSFFVPAIAAGMAQSDYNRIVNKESHST